MDGQVIITFTFQNTFLYLFSINFQIKILKEKYNEVNDRLWIIFEIQLKQQKLREKDEQYSLSFKKNNDPNIQLLLEDNSLKGSKLVASPTFAAPSSANSNSQKEAYLDIYEKAKADSGTHIYIINIFPFIINSI